MKQKTLFVIFKGLSLNVVKWCHNWELTCKSFTEYIRASNIKQYIKPLQPLKVKRNSAQITG